MNRAFQFIAVAVSITLNSSLLSPCLLFAQPPGRGGPPGMDGRGGPPTEMIIQLFTQADANGDGSVTKAELTAVLETQGRGNQMRRGGPPQQGGNFDQGNQQNRNQPPQDVGHHGPPPTPGEILPESIAQSLGLSDKQTRKIAALQADVDKRLAAILTDEQEEQLQNAGPPHGGVQGGEIQQGNRGNGRPQRPQ